MLSEHCAEQLPLWSDTSPRGLERVRFAAVRFSGGELPRLADAIRLAHKDWRDLLVSAKFADSVHAHSVWKPRRLEQAIVERWLQGRRIDGVNFAPGDLVQLQGSPGPAGRIAALVGLEPEPRLRVQLNDGRTVELFQFAIRHAG
jgi:hypothetical protein